MNTQPELLEQYLIALRRDSRATPSPGLDPALASFARRLATQSMPPTDAAIRARVWQKSLNNVRVQSPGFSSNGKQHHDPLNQEKIHMTAFPAASLRVMPPIFTSRQRSRPILTMIAATIALIFAGMIVFSPRSDKPNQEAPIYPGGLSSQEQGAQQASSTPSPAPAPAVMSGACSQFHTVEAGDTLLGIAGRYSIPPGTLLTLNGLNNPGAGGIIVGQSLCVSQDVLMATALPQANLVPTATLIAYTYPLSFSPENAVLIQAGDAVTGELVAETPVVAYRLVADQAGALFIDVQSEDFEPILNFTPDVAQWGQVFAPAPVIAMVDPTLDAMMQVSPLQASPVPFTTELVPTVVAPANITATATLAVTPTFVPTAPAEAWAQPIMPDVIYMNEPYGFTFSAYSNPAEIVPVLIVAEGQEIYLMVQGMTGTETGAFTLETRYLEATPIAIGDVVEASISEDAPFAYYTFEAQAGDVINVGVTGVDGFNTNVLLAETSQQFNWMDDDSGAGSDPEIYQMRLPADGVYHLVVRATKGDDDANGSFTLTLESNS